MANPYPIIFMVMLALLVLEAERSLLLTTQQCSNSFAARMGPRVPQVKDPQPIIVEMKNSDGELQNITHHPMCVAVNDTEDKNVTGTHAFNFLMSANQWGLLVAAVPAGCVAVCCSSYNMLLGGHLVIAIATILVPLVSVLHWVVVVIVQVMLGVGMAFVLPAVYLVMADWNHSYWRTATICFCLAGRPIGQLVSLSLVALSCDWSFFPGWMFSHFIIGFVGLVWCALWLCIAHARGPCCCPSKSCCKHGKAFKKKKKNNRINQCAQRMLLMKVWSAVLKQSAVWGMAVAWCGTDILWMLLELYSSILNRVNFMNEIWTSAALISTAVMTIIVGVLADKVINCNAESYRYIRKVFDGFGKVIVVILSIVMIRLEFQCERWTLVMTVFVLVIALHSFQFAGCHSNIVDIGDPGTGITVSMALLLSALGRLGMWNGLYYTIPMNMNLLSFQHPLYGTSVLLAFGIVIYGLFGSPELYIYMPPGWDIIPDPAENPDLKQTGCICCPKTIPAHRNILKIMDEACNKNRIDSGSSSVASRLRNLDDVHSPSRRTRGESESSYAEAEARFIHPDYTDATSGPVGSSGRTRSGSDHSDSTVRTPSESHIRFADDYSTGSYPRKQANLSEIPEVHRSAIYHSSPSVRPKLPMVTLEKIEDVDSENEDDLLQVPSVGAGNLRGGRFESPQNFSSSPRLRRSNAIVDEEVDSNEDSSTGQRWLRAESEL